MIAFERENDTVFRLKVPFERIYTSVFLIEASKRILVDCATSAKDVETYIIPALQSKGYELSDLGALVLTHQHADHAGGFLRVMELAPNIEVIKEVCEICDGVCTYPMSGHTEDSIGVLDMRTGILISGDGLQGAGVDKYRCNVKSPEEYLSTLERIKQDGRIERILFSHAYEPWNCDSIVGREKINDVIAICKEYVKK